LLPHAHSRAETREGPGQKFKVVLHCVAASPWRGGGAHAQCSSKILSADAMQHRPNRQKNKTCSCGATLLGRGWHPQGLRALLPRRRPLREGVAPMRGVTRKFCRSTLRRVDRHELRSSLNISALMAYAYDLLPRAPNTPWPCRPRSCRQLRRHEARSQLGPWLG
jgi:hypothetical protein